MTADLLSRSDLARFALVAVLGLGIDFAVASVAALAFGWPLAMAAAAGFVVAACVNYLLHERWTFGGGDRRLSAGRGAAYAAGLALTLGVRVGAVAALEQLFPARALLVLGIATALSFTTNYLFSKHLVFRQGQPDAR